MIIALTAPHGISSRPTGLKSAYSVLSSRRQEHRSRAEKAVGATQERQVAQISGTLMPPCTRRWSELTPSSRKIVSAERDSQMRNARRSTRSRMPSARCCAPRALRLVPSGSLKQRSQKWLLLLRIESDMKPQQR